MIRLFIRKRPRLSSGVCSGSGVFISVELALDLCRMGEGASFLRDRSKHVKA